MNRGELRNLTLYWLDDLNAGYFTPTQVNTWLDNAQNEVQKRLIKAGQNYYIDCLQTTTVYNQTDYVLPENFKKLHRVEIVQSGTPPNEVKYPLKQITLNQQDFGAFSNGAPQMYYLKKNRITILPAPDRPYIMRLYETYLVSPMTSDLSIPDVPPAYHELLALLAAQDGFLKDGRASEVLMKKLKEYEDDFDSDANERLQDQPREVVDTGFGNDGEFYW